MIKRTIEISGADTSLSVHNDQLHIRRNGEDIGQTPIEDIGVLIVDAPTVSYTHTTLVRLSEYGAVTVLCGNNHLPAAMVTPLQGNSLLPERLRLQISVSEPLRKRIWQEIVREKILNQAAICEDPIMQARILGCAKDVRSGDPQNVEAQAARFHWAVYLPELQFHRGREEEEPNGLLNYGYAIIRAAVARALCGAGLHPTLGVQHANRTNAFALADDLMEPLRPLVDHRVRQLWRAGQREVKRETKAALLQLLTQTCEMDEQTGPLLVALERLAVSYVGRLSGQEKALRIPKYREYFDLPS